MESRLLQSKITRVKTAHARRRAEEQNKSVMSKHFIRKIGEILNLISLNEPNYEDLKAQLTTKVRMKKINVLYLKDDRAQLHSSI